MATPLLSRRAALLGLSAAWSLGPFSMAVADTPARTATDDPRFVVVILRGALDGLAAVVPYGDRSLAGWRAPLLPDAVGQTGGMLDLGGFFGLHPALAGMHGLYAAGEMLPVHAVSGGYRSRSHFDAQDFLESGTDHRLNSGWLNRVVGEIPANRDRGPDGEGLTIGLSTPLLMRGPARIGAYSPENGAMPSADLYARIAALNAHDRLTGPVMADAMASRGFSADVLGMAGHAPGGRPGGGNGFPGLARAAGQLLAAANGPRVAALELGGWDTHAGQKNRLHGPLSQLDAGLLALKEGIGPEAWRRTAVLVMTEFGRTVRINGTGGTDHGTATVAFLLGGAVAGGKVGGTWPGLTAGQLLDNRDLMPTNDLRGVAKGVLATHLGLRPASLDRVFPGTAGVSAMGGLIRV